MTEPTLAQWQERALVAEALLEERTQECEKLRAQLEDAKTPAVAKQPDKIDPRGGRLSSIARQVLEQMRRSGAERGMDYASAERRMMEEIMRGDQWSPEEMRALMEDLASPEFKRIPPPKPDRSPPKFADFAEELKHYAPAARISVSAQITPERGNVRLTVVLDGGKPQMYELSREEYAAMRARPMGLMNVANSAARAIADKLYLSSRDQSELAQRVLDALGNL